MGSKLSEKERASLLQSDNSCQKFLQKCVDCVTRRNGQLIKGQPTKSLLPKSQLQSHLEHKMTQRRWLTF
jgi:hypothetical protein